MSQDAEDSAKIEGDDKYDDEEEEEEEYEVEEKFVGTCSIRDKERF